MPGGFPDRLARPYRLSRSTHGDTCAARVARAFGDIRGFLARGGAEAASGDLRPGQFFCRIDQLRDSDRRTASFLMPGQEFELPQSLARLTLPLTVPAATGCVRIAVDAQDPVGVVVARAAATSRAVTPVLSLPNTSTSDDRRMPSRDTIVTVVLGGELAVPCTRNPLQRG